MTAKTALLCPAGPWDSHIQGGEGEVEWEREVERWRERGIGVEGPPGRTTEQLGRGNEPRQASVPLLDLGEPR